MKFLNLFSGTGSVSKPWRDSGHEVFDVDIDPTFEPDYCGDILQFDYKSLDFIPDVIWASPPCDQYSRARTRAKTPRNLALAERLVAKALEIIYYFVERNPDLIWFVENGDSTMLWETEVAKSLVLGAYVVLDYCCYGKLYRKRTRVAHSANLMWRPRELCKPLTCHACVGGKHVKTAQRGPCGGRIGDVCTLNELHALPSELCQEILEVCTAHSWQLL